MTDIIDLHEGKDGCFVSPCDHNPKAPDALINETTLRQVQTYLRCAGFLSGGCFLVTVAVLLVDPQSPEQITAAAASSGAVFFLIARALHKTHPQRLQPEKRVPIINRDGVFAFSCFILAAIIVRYVIKILGF